MGSQIALRLALNGHNIAVFSRDRIKVQKIITTNITTNLRTANLPKEIGDTCDIVIICVKDYQAVSDVSFSSGGLTETKYSDLIVVQCSTISPEESSSMAGLYSKKHIRMLSVLY